MDKSVEIGNEIDSTEIANSFKCKIEELPFTIRVIASDFTVITQNIRSIYANIDDLQLTLAELKFDVDILVLTECRLKGDKPIPQLTNYNSYTTSNHLNQNDGVTAYIKNNHFAIVNEIILEHASCLQITIYHTIILCIYRSPSNHNTENFTNSLNNHLESIKLFEKIIIVGDININIIPKPEERNSGKNNRLNYLNTLSLHGLLPGHYLPTRDNNCLDHFILKLNKAKTVATIAVLDTSTTDHLMILLTLSKTTYLSSIRKTKIFIDFEKAIQNLHENYTDLLLLNDPNILSKLLINRIQKSLADNTKTIHIPRSKRIIKPWITPGILRCINNRNSMQMKLRCDPKNDILKISYRRYRNFCNNLIKKLKRKYERDQLEISSKNSKALWKSINNVTHYKPAKTPNTQLLSTKVSPLEAVNFVNTYFANIGKTLAEDITQQNKELNNIPSNLLSNQMSSLVFLATDHKEIFNVVLNLKSKSAPGWDNIQTNFLKLSSHVLIPIICHLVNLCLDQGIFPKIFKQSIITPVYKGGDRDDVSNYRPISVLPSISKVLEKIINKRLLGYLDKYNIISKHQYGFRQGVSTEDAVTALSNLIVNHVDKGRKCITVFLDLKKAFDTVSVPILVHKLENIGVRGVPLALLIDYLHERKQRVKIGGFESEDVPINYGVPQGSVLGPTLFLTYINDLCDLEIQHGNIFSYADDTAIIFTGTSWDDVKDKAEKGLEKVAKWLKLNLLTLNVSKTNFICFTKYNRTQPNSDFNIKIHECGINKTSCLCSSIKKVETTKYLGIFIDQRLSWHAHIELLTSRTRKLIWIFKNLRHVAKPDLLNKIYVALAQSILTYCIPIWGGATKTIFLNLERAQRSLLKVMFFKPYRYPTSSLYSISDTLTVRKLYVLHSVLKLHKSLEYNPFIINKRRNYTVTNKIHVNSTFAARQYTRQSALLYNKLNKTLNIYSMNNHKCKSTLAKYLLKLNYDEVEALLEIII